MFFLLRKSLFHTNLECPRGNKVRVKEASHCSMWVRVQGCKQPCYEKEKVRKLPGLWESIGFDNRALCRLTAMHQTELHLFCCCADARELSCSGVHFTHQSDCSSWPSFSAAHSAECGPFIKRGFTWRRRALACMLMPRKQRISLARGLSMKT